MQAVVRRVGHDGGRQRVEADHVSQVNIAWNKERHNYQDTITAIHCQARVTSDKILIQQGAQCDLVLLLRWWLRPKVFQRRSCR